MPTFRGEEVIGSLGVANRREPYDQNGQIAEADWLEPAAVNQRTLHQGNSVLRGGLAPASPRDSFLRG